MRQEKHLDKSLREDIASDILFFLGKTKSIDAFKDSIFQYVQQNTKDQAVKIILADICVKLQVLNIANDFKDADTIEQRIHPNIWNFFERTVLFLKTDLALVKQPKKIGCFIFFFVFWIGSHLLLVLNLRVGLNLQVRIFLFLILLQSIVCLISWVLFEKFSDQKKLNEIIKSFKKEIDLNLKKRFLLSPFFPFENEETYNHWGKNVTSLLPYRLKTKHKGRNKDTANAISYKILGKNFLIQEALLKVEQAFYGWGYRPVLIGYCQKLTPTVRQFFRSSDEGWQEEITQELKEPDIMWIFSGEGFRKISTEKYQELSKNYGPMQKAYVMVDFKFFVDTTKNYVRFRDIAAPLAAQHHEYELDLNGKEMTIHQITFAVS